MMIAELWLQVKQDHDMPPGWVVTLVIALLAAGDCG